MVVSIVLLLIVIALVDAPDLVRRKMWGELAAFSIYSLIGAALVLPQVLGVRLPDPTNVIEAIFAPLADLLK
ncbi:MAG: hypothetical protein NUV93_00810 [Firmicutes bacterium]|nr:hypothetical protein [Bacillota bacterium]